MPRTARRPTSPKGLLLPDFAAPLRPSFFAGRLLTADDLQREQDYHRSMRRLHNLAVLGVGVVAGLKVSGDPGGVRVSRGWAVDPLGREVVVPDDAVIPWPKVRTAGRMYVVLTYREENTDPAPMPGLSPADGETTDTLNGAAALNATVRETFELKLSTKRPTDDEVAVIVGRARREGRTRRVNRARPRGTDKGSGGTGKR